MRPKPAALIVGLSLLCAAPAVFAHHQLEARFDTKRTIVLIGEVARIDWSNPHVRLYMEVKDQSGTVTWEVDLGSPNKQMMNGWKIDTYRRGDRVRADVYPA